MSEVSVLEGIWQLELPKGRPAADNKCQTVQCDPKQCSAVPKVNQQMTRVAAH